MTAFDGLAATGQEKGVRDIPLPWPINFAYSTDCCHVVMGARTDAEIGRFYAEGGFVPEADSLPDKVFELLDFACIGRDNAALTPYGMTASDAHGKACSRRNGDAVSEYLGRGVRTDQDSPSTTNEKEPTRQSGGSVLCQLSR